MVVINKLELEPELNSGATPYIKAEPD